MFQATKHMTARMQQRCISKEAINVILDNGDWGQGDDFFMDKKSIENLIKQKRSEIDALEKIKRRGGVKIILDRNQSITTYCING